MIQFLYEKVGQDYLVAISGRMDATTAGEFDEQCEHWLSQDEIHILVDMGGVEYISSAGLRSILNAAKKLRARGGDICFFGLTGLVADVFQLSGFSTIFNVFETREQALGG